METDIVNYKGFFVVKKDGTGEVTESYAPEDSCVYGLMYLFPNIPDCVSYYVLNKRVVVQAGGNFGLYVKKYAGIFNRVYTFEPSPLLFKCLDMNIVESNVVKFNACLGANNNSVSIGNTLLNIGSTHVLSTRGDIPTIMIDDLGLNICDLIHLDIEGYEYFALLGAIETIKRCRPIIAIEWYSPWAIRYGVTLNMMNNLLNSLNYCKIASLLGNDIIYKYDQNKQYIPKYLRRM